MKTTKLLTMAAAVALLSAPAIAETTVTTKVGERVTYKVTDNPAPNAEIVGYQVEQNQKFARLDANLNGTVSMKEFQNGVMLENEAEIFALFDSDQSGEITPEEFSNNSRYGNAELANKTSNKTRSSNNWGSMREKYYVQDVTTYEPAAGEMTVETTVDAGIDYNGIDEEPAVNAGIDYQNDASTPRSVKSETTYN